MSRFELWLEGRGVSPGDTWARVLQAEGTPEQSAAENQLGVSREQEERQRDRASRDKRVGEGRSEVRGARPHGAQVLGEEPWGLLQIQWEPTGWSAGGEDWV